MTQLLKQLVLASNNQGKLKEMTALLAPLGIAVIPQSQFGVEEVEETGTTFVENALLKAKHASAISGLPALADDSGLVVPALGGAPGIYSARYGRQTPQEAKSDAKNNQKLLAELADRADREAEFVCVMTLCLSPKHPLPMIAQGIWRGQIAHTLKGDGGFGYDPLFIIPELEKTAAQLTPAEKNQMSHRAKALNHLIGQLEHLS